MEGRGGGKGIRHYVATLLIYLGPGLDRSLADHIRELDVGGGRRKLPLAAFWHHDLDDSTAVASVL